MAHLDRLTITTRIIQAPGARHKVETAEYRRKKLIAHIEEQTELALLALEGKPLQLQRKRGHTTVRVRPRLWWRQDADGTVLTQIRYNKIAMNLAGRGATIEVGPMKKLPSVYRTVVKAIEAGELDAAIENAARKSRPS